ncbi:hypothetical protein CFO_g5320 [Ceratocystis platani]|uniref:Uncharacterized protein n=1 Tax=Ceratocystis fimbriata f. sp. platani TaxID=88771 RepID=A0A0F8AWL2_CERFI|nr:hypothetical protein CFO_g5320 [Ceratocystis platani]
MRFLTTLLPLALSLLSLSQATILDDHGYMVKTLENFDGVFISDENGDPEMVYGIGFYPSDKAVALRIFDNEQESGRKHKLELSQIYNAIAKARGWKREDLEWVVFETSDDQPTMELISDIRNNRKLDSMEHVSIKPGNADWKEIFGTNSFQQAAMIKGSSPDTILIRAIQRTMLEMTYQVDCLCFHFVAPEIGTQEDKESTSATGKQTENSGGDREEEWDEKWEPEWEAEGEDEAALRVLSGEAEE